jgi:hypothetical protein
MPVPGVGEPNIPGTLVFSMNNVVPLSPPPNPTSIVQAGQPVELRVELGIDGGLTGLLLGESYQVFHHVERVEDGDRKTLAGGTFTVPSSAAAAASFNEVTGPYTTSDSGAADFEVPAGFDSGTFRILTHIHFVDPGKEPIVTAFHDMILMVA